MKHIIPSILLICFPLFHGELSAQDNTEAKVLFGDGGSISAKDLGFYISPTYGFTQMDGSHASLFQFRGGISFKDKLTIGGYFNTSINEIMPQSETVPNVYMDYWSVGGFAEYTLLSKKVFHLTFPFYIGYGEVEMDDEYGDERLGEANFLQLEPSALLEVNLHRFVRINLGAGYRVVGQMSYRNFDQSDISGMTGYVGLKFGLFR
jgi:hypothetical protein